MGISLAFRFTSNSSVVQRCEEFVEMLYVCRLSIQNDHHHFVKTAVNGRNSYVYLTVEMVVRVFTVFSSTKCNQTSTFRSLRTADAFPVVASRASGKIAREATTGNASAVRRLHLSLPSPVFAPICALASDEPHVTKGG